MRPFSGSAIRSVRLKESQLRSGFEKCGTLAFDTSDVSCHESGDLEAQLYCLHHDPEYLTPAPGRLGLGDPGPDSEPALFTYRCLLCATRFAATVYWSPQGASLTVLPLSNTILSAGIAEVVAFHLNEAYLCHCIGANTAAGASFRAALEQLLDAQGYTEGMLDKKIDCLIADSTAGTGPTWAARIEPEFMRVINRLGNKSVHPKSVSRLAAYDAALTTRLHVTFIYLLNAIYGNGSATSELLHQLQIVRGKVT